MENAPHGRLGSTPASGVAGRASRPALLRPEPSRAFVVFREGAENGTRGAVLRSSTAEGGRVRSQRGWSARHVRKRQPGCAMAALGIDRSDWPT
jgi:hypothetical protein